MKVIITDQLIYVSSRAKAANKTANNNLKAGTRSDRSLANTGSGTQYRKGLIPSVQEPEETRRFRGFREVFVIVDFEAIMSRLREEDDPYVVEEPSDEDPAESRSRGFRESVPPFRVCFSRAGDGWGGAYSEVPRVETCFCHFNVLITYLESTVGRKRFIQSPSGFCKTSA